MPEPRIMASGLRLRTAVLLWGTLGSAFGQAALVATSPFLPSGSSASAASSPAEAYELAGSSVQGSEVDVCVFDSHAKRSEWIPVGGVSDGIHVISFDEDHDRAVVVIGGERKELGLRKASVSGPHAAAMAWNPPAAPSVVEISAPPASDSAAPQAPAPDTTPKTPAMLAHEQSEARMLVSDLLEISVEQRKAYQDAKQKAAAETPPPSN